MLITLPAPDPINGGNLADELAVALGLPEPPELYVAGQDVVIPVPDGTDEAAVRTVVEVHTGLPTSEQQAELDADAEASQRVRDLEPILDKCRAVLRGEDSFTNQQAQRLLAALVLVVHRRL